MLQDTLTVPLRNPAPLLQADAVYLLADADITIGGDWYDLVPVGEAGNLMMIVGDVVGSGIRAADTMGQLRAGSHALAPRSSAVEILTGLDAFVSSHPNAMMATVACVLVDVSGGTATISLAGHPPPLIDGHGEASFVDAAPSPPLGIAGRRAEVTVP